MNHQFAVHPQLKSPLVKEALLEIRFPPSPHLPYGLIPGRLYESLKTNFSKILELPSAQIPLDFGTEHLVRHRFLTEDETRMFQVGVGVLSINHVGYTGFSDFITDCRFVLEAAADIGLFAKVDRIALRYINKAYLDRSWNEIVQVKVEAPEVIEALTKAQLFRWFTDFPNAGVLSTTLAWPTIEENVPMLVLDLDHFNELVTDISLARITDWLSVAHENIYQVFKSILQPEYFAQLERGLDVYNF